MGRVADALPALDPTAPVDISRAGDEFLFSWPSLGVALGLASLREATDGLHAEVTVQSSTAPEPISHGRLNLVSTTSKEGLVAKLGKVDAEIPWRGIIEHVCWRTAQQFRAGEPVQVLRPVRATSTRYLVEKLLPLGQTTVGFGDGGSGKSLLALAVAAATVTQTPLPHGLKPTERAHVLYLDWESEQDVHADCLACLMAGMNITDAPGLYYRRMYRAFADDVPRLRAEIDRRGIKLVIVDSFGLACGGEPETADSAIRLMNALRSFGPTVTRFVIAHVSRASAEQRNGAARPFGSVYVQNLARSVWEIRRPQDDVEGDAAAMGLFHRKVNVGRRLPPMGFTVEYGSGVIRLLAQDLANEPELAARASLSYRLLQSLKAGERTVQELAEQIDTTENAVRVVLSRLQGKGKVIRLDEARDRKNVWGLKHEA